MILSVTYREIMLNKQNRADRKSSFILEAVFGENKEPIASKSLFRKVYQVYKTGIFMNGHRRLIKDDRIIELEREYIYSNKNLFVVLSRTTTKGGVQ